MPTAIHPDGVAGEAIAVHEPENGLGDLDFAVPACHVASRAPPWRTSSEEPSGVPIGQGEAPATVTAPRKRFRVPKARAGPIPRKLLIHKGSEMVCIVLCLIPSASTPPIAG